MPQPPDSRKYLDSVLIVFLLTAALFISPLFSAWATPAAPWYLPYIVWLLVIALIALVQYLRKHYEL